LIAVPASPREASILEAVFSVDLFTSVAASPTASAPDFAAILTSFVSDYSPYKLTASLTELYALLALF